MGFEGETDFPGPFSVPFSSVGWRLGNRFGGAHWVTFVQRSQPIYALSVVRLIITLLEVNHRSNTAPPPFFVDKETLIMIS